MPKGNLTGDYTCDAAIADVWYEFRQYASATDRVNAAYHLMSLSDKIGDLASWHVNYDSESGEIKGVYEDESTS